MPIKSNVQHKNVVIVKPVNNISKLIKSKTKTKMINFLLILTRELLELEGNVVTIGKIHW